MKNHYSSYISPPFLVRDKEKLFTVKVDEIIFMNLWVNFSKSRHKSYRFNPILNSFFSGKPGLHCFCPRVWETQIDFVRSLARNSLYVFTAREPVPSHVWVRPYSDTIRGGQSVNNFC